MQERPRGQIERPVDSLSDLVLSEETLDSLLGHIGRLAIDSVPGFDAAGTTLVERDQVATFGITDPRINSVDQNQYDTGKGPCVDAFRSGEVRYFDGTEIEPRWRQFAEAAADAGVYSVLSFPLKVDDQVLGAMNLYSHERGALRPGAKEEGWVFAAQAAVTLANAQEVAARGEQVAQLQEALETRTLIGQATGLLMAQEGLTSDEAFKQLVAISQNANVKLREIAQRYVQDWEQRAKT